MAGRRQIPERPGAVLGRARGPRSCVLRFGSAACPSRFSVRSPTRDASQQTGSVVGRRSQAHAPRKVPRPSSPSNLRTSSVAWNSSRPLDPEPSGRW
jgi:hypothetical protein